MSERETVAPIVAEFEQKKEEHKAKYDKKRKSCTITLAIGGVLLIAGMIFDNYLLILFIAALFCFYKTYDIVSSANETYHRRLDKLWKAYLTKFYIPYAISVFSEGKVTDEVEDDTRIPLKDGCLSDFQDSFSCCYDNELYRITNYRAYNFTTDKEGKTYEWNEFDGMIVSKPIKKNVSTEIIISSNSLLTQKNEGVGMDNEFFNKKFKVIAEDMKDAFVALTPEVMESILNLKKLVDIESILIRNERMYVFINEAKMRFDIQDEYLIKMRDWNKALKYISVDSAIENVTKFRKHATSIFETIKKIKI